ncbi:uncharacterized protein C4orf17 homolog [Patagioenas fasciata]|uniref:uncharacterized protein C4orf17 homolog n=1 Tax=Patagioenas fasciata TaxID=372321 RepID=UPI003A99C6EB
MPEKLPSKPSGPAGARKGETGSSIHRSRDTPPEQIKICPPETQGSSSADPPPDFSKNQKLHFVIAVPKTASKHHIIQCNSLPASPEQTSWATPRSATDPNPRKDVGPCHRESITCAANKKVLPTQRPAQKEITYSSSGSETSLSVTPTLTRFPGINNALICFVRTSFSRADPSAGDTGIPKQAAHQERVLTGNAASNTSANRCLPKLEGSVQRELRTPESLTQGRVHVPEMTQNTPSFEKVLGKLSKILQTDSLTKIQKWFATASEKEKEDIFRLIYSEPTDKGMLNSKEGTAETVRSPSLQKPFSPLRRSPEGIRSQSR